MNTKHQTKLTSREEEQQQQVSGQEATQRSATEFASVEEMLRHDALRTPVPPSVAERLGESIGSTAPQGRAWWRRFFGC
jgi:hypothetical protein